MVTAALVEHVDHWQHRVVAEAIRDAESWQWLRRAAEWETAAPKPTDYHGGATREELSAAWRRCMETAAACRARAEVSLLSGVVW
jgi:hypothetical protein